MPATRTASATDQVEPVKPKVLVFASTKGGAGKTTMAFSLAVEMGRRLKSRPQTADQPTAQNADIPDNQQAEDPEAATPVICIDADPNEQLIYMLKRGKPEQVSFRRANEETFFEVLRRARGQGPDIIIVDLEGAARESLIFAASKADLVLIPSQPSALDVREAARTVDHVKRASMTIDREIAYRVVMSRVPSQQQRVAAHSAKQFAVRGLPALEVGLAERTVLKQMTFTGVPPAPDGKDRPAAENIAEFADAVAKLLGLKLKPVTKAEKGPAPAKRARAPQKETV